MLTQYPIMLVLQRSWCGAFQQRRYWRTTKYPIKLVLQNEVDTTNDLSNGALPPNGDTVTGLTNENKSTIEPVDPVENELQLITMRMIPATMLKMRMRPATMPRTKTIMMR